MNNREKLVFFGLWLVFPLVAILKPNTFIGGASLVFTFQLPAMFALSMFVDRIEAWLRRGDKKDE